MEYTPALERAEQSVVGAVFLDNGVYERAGLTDQQFYDPRLNRIWSAVGALRARGAPVDEVTIAEELGTLLQTVGGLNFIADLALVTPTADNAEHYAAQVRESWLTRRIMLAASEVLEHGKLGIGGDSLLERFQSALEGLNRDQGREMPTLQSIALGASRRL